MYFSAFRGAHERPHDGNHLRPAAKELLGPTDHQVKTARTLKDGRTGDDRRDDEQDRTFKEALQNPHL